MNTLFGIAIGITLISISFLIEGGSLLSLFMIAPIIIVVGGTLLATLAGSSWEQFSKLTDLIRIAINREIKSKDEVVDDILKFTSLAKREGRLIADSKLEQIEDPFLKKLLRMYIDGTPKEQFSSITNNELDQITERHQENIDLFQKMGGFSPTMGIIGTVMGLITALSSSVDDPSMLIQRIAFAFIATLWGIFMANLVWFPLADKLRTLHSKEIKNYEIMIVATEALINDEVPSMIRKRIAGFFTLDEQERILSNTPIQFIPKEVVNK